MPYLTLPFHLVTGDVYQVDVKILQSRMLDLGSGSVIVQALRDKKN